MFDKIKLKFLKKALEAAYPNRDINVDKIGNHFIAFNRDEVGCRDFLLKGQYTYDQVVKLNSITGYNAEFDYCKELGPVAFSIMIFKNMVILLKKGNTILSNIVMKMQIK